MDKETFEKVAKISEEMKLLQLVIKNISRNTFLSFVERGFGYEVSFTSTQKDVIKDILSRHEVEIRQEIEDRYNNLKKQIEEL